jgi:hypothetical protein
MQLFRVFEVMESQIFNTNVFPQSMMCSALIAICKSDDNHREDLARGANNTIAALFRFCIRAHSLSPLSSGLFACKLRSLASVLYTFADSVRRDAGIYFLFASVCAQNHSSCRNNRRTYHSQVRAAAI